MLYTNEKLGLFNYDLNNDENIKKLESKGFNIELLRFQVLKKEYLLAVSSYLDGVAVFHGYDSALSFCSYALGSDSYALEAQKFISFRSSVWDYAFLKFEEVKRGDVLIPELSYFISTLPKFEDVI